ncbi:MAG: sugar ABC transporter permease [Deltaproteobacteria bacterium]|nr:sugar ABC transporter permease [Deltaproteobacteria bacterium]
MFPRSAMRKPRLTERPFLFVLPALGLMVAVAFYPLASTVWLSFYDELPIFGISRFVGLSHYAELWHDPRFWHSLSNTLYFSALSVTLEVILGLCAALLLQQVFPARGLVRALVLIPWFIPTVVAARLWEWIYNPQLGVLNFLLRESGLSADGFNWLGQPSLALHAAILADVWKTTPFAALLILAGLETIPLDLYRAARVDGAGPGQAFWHITLPLLMPVLGITFLFRTLDAMRVFDIVYVLTGGGPANTTETLSIYAYRLSFQTLQFGYGAAVAVMIFALVLGVSLLSLSALRRLGIRF